MSPIDVDMISTGPPFGSGLLLCEQLGNVKSMVIANDSTCVKRNILVYSPAREIPTRKLF